MVGVRREGTGGVKLTKKELKGLVNKAKDRVLTTAESIRTSTQDEGEPGVSDAGDQFNMEDYDKEDEVQSLIGIGNMMSLDEESDESETESQAEEEEDEDEDDSDKEDDEIKPTDNLIAVGHVYGDISILEVYVYNEEGGDLYVHHDVMLPTIPLALEWLSYVPSQSMPGNLLAMGGMSPEILVWDLDVTNTLEPLLQLGEFSETKKYQHRNHGHTDAVLDLSWNCQLPHILASGSVDRSVLLWDLGKARAVSQFKQFKEKVQTLEWHPSEVNVLVTGTCDRKVQLLDCRIGETLTSIKVDGEVEKVIWHPSSQFSALIGTSKGTLGCADFRTKKLVWAINAHEEEVTGLAADCDSIVTSSTDQTVKVWGLSGGEPTLRFTKHTGLGELHTLQMCPENSNIICVGGSKSSKNFSVYNLSEMQQERPDMETEQQEEDT
ncbi:rRNA-processing protein [Homalodisca vitripennis]|nr:rRNA-processing protein [Homalodisca vitripennis]